MSKIIIATPAMLKALDDYAASLKLGAKHVARIMLLCQRVEALSLLGRELYAALQVQQEIALEAVKGDDPEPAAYDECLAAYEDYKVVYRLMQVAVVEATTEKDFIDWHAVTVLKPQYDEIMKIMDLQ